LQKHEHKRCFNQLFNFHALEEYGIHPNTNDDSERFPDFKDVKLVFRKSLGVEEVVLDVIVPWDQDASDCKEHQCFVDFFVLQSFNDLVNVF
jgi:hypothetical protein